jgi:hypothetical protein
MRSETGTSIVILFPRPSITGMVGSAIEIIPLTMTSHGIIRCGFIPRFAVATTFVVCAFPIIWGILFGFHQRPSLVKYLGVNHSIT